MTDASPEIVEIIATQMCNPEKGEIWQHYAAEARAAIADLDAAGYEIAPKGTADNARLLDSVDDLRAYAARVNDDKMMRELMAIYSRITAAMIAASQEGKK